MSRQPMVYYEQVDRLQKQFTDKYVVVDESRPELRRFAGQTGVVKTVNMNGRALVQFDAFNNIGWYDIDPSFLRIVDAPLPKPEAKKEKAAPPKAEAPAAAKPAAAKPAAPKAAGSVADILAAARGGAKAAPAKPAEAAAPSAQSAAPAASPAAKPAAADPKAMSVADILAAARGKTAAPPTAAPKAEAPKPAPAAPAAETEAAPPTDPEPVVADAPPPAEPASASSGGKLSKKDQFTTVADILAYCRQTDGK